GKHPDTGLPIYVLTGRYGPYVQMGDDEPKRTSIPAGMSVDDIDMPKALFLLSLPKDLGAHPSLNKPVKLGIGRFGPYVVCDGDFRSIPKAQPLFDVNFDFAMQLLSQPKKGRGVAAPLKEFGEHPDSGDKIQLLNGKYGPYIKCGKVNASVPEDMAVEAVTREKALELIEARGGAKKGGGKKGKKTAATKSEKAGATEVVAGKALAKAEKKTAAKKAPVVSAEKGKPVTVVVPKSKTTVKKAASTVASKTTAANVAIASAKSKTAPKTIVRKQKS
ncbi:hypothetical protein K2X05_09805, partial [bacterium]|nr:hypothetical protein [bacterium]